MNEWNWTKDQLDQGRVERARKIKLANVVCNNEECCAECVSKSSGEVYRVSLGGCTCRDFTVGKKPCKHMIALAMAAGFIDKQGLTPKEKVESWKCELAKAYGYFYLFKKRIMSDEEYDRLKYEIADWWGFGDESEKIMDEIAPRLQE